MRLRADLLINDCERAINKHTESLQAEDFRLSWFSIICLLRAIGHVLDKVDSNISPELKKVINRKFEELKRSKPRPELYWSFIELERNRFLKEYEHGIKRDITFKGTVVDGKQILMKIDVGNSQNSIIGSPHQPFRSVISSGVFAGRPEKEVAIEALKWWKEYIAEIKKEVGE